MRNEKHNQEMENEEGWASDDLDLDQTLIQSQTPEENPTPPSLLEDEGTA